MSTGGQSQRLVSAKYNDLDYELEMWREKEKTAHSNIVQNPTLRATRVPKTRETKEGLRTPEKFDP